MMDLRRLFPTVAVIWALLTLTLAADMTGLSWGGSRMDLFGVTEEGDIWHKYFTGSEWQPNDSQNGNVELFKDAHAKSAVRATAWSENHLNFVFIDDKEKVRHKYWTGSEWGPSGGFESLGKSPVGHLAINSWGKNRLDIFGIGNDSDCLHKAWTGDTWYPAVHGWERLGGDFEGVPTAISWGPNRLDIFAVKFLGSLYHRFWDGYQWQPADAWEYLGGDDLSPNITLSSPEPGRLDVWAVDASAGELHHIFYNKHDSAWTKWENLGGSNFTNAPQAVHWDAGRIDLLGNAKGQYLYKYWDGQSWSQWYQKGGAFSSEPATVSIHANNLNFFGIDTEGKILLQVWDGSQWLPDPTGWYVLGDIKGGKKINVSPADSEQQSVLELEL